MEVSENLMLQYVAAMAHQEVFQQQINIYKFIRNRLRRRRGARARRIWIRPWLHPERRLQFGIYDQLMLELRREDPRTFKKFLCMPTEMYDEIFGRVRHRLLKQHTLQHTSTQAFLVFTLQHKPFWSWILFPFPSAYLLHFEMVRLITQHPQRCK